MVTAAELSENSRQGFDFQNAARIGLASELRRNPRWRCGHIYDETAVGIAVYVRNDPVNLVDPDGRFWNPFSAAWNGLKAVSNALSSLALFVGQHVADFMDYTLHSTVSAFQTAQQQALVTAQVAYSVGSFTGFGPKQIYFGPDDPFTKEFMTSSSMDQVRENLKQNCEGMNGTTSVGTKDAFFNTIFDALYKGVNLPEAQVGAFFVSWSRNDDNSMNIVISNSISFNSWALHIPEKVDLPTDIPGDLPFGSVDQYIFFSIEDPCDEKP